MPLVRPRITTSSDFVTMEFAVPEADPRAFYIEIRGERLYITGKYAADVRGMPFAIYPQSGNKLKGDFAIPAAVSSDTRYVGATYNDGFLSVRMRRADEYPERTVRVYLH